MGWNKTQNIRGPSAASTDAGNLTRAGSDGLLYTPAAWLLTADLTLHVATTGSDTTGDGSQAAPWATPHRVMAFLRGLLLADGVFVTISIADGAYTFSKELNLNHPQGTQISIEGTSTSGTRPTGTSLNGGGGIPQPPNPSTTQNSRRFTEPNGSSTAVTGCAVTSVAVSPLTSF